ncbi:alpha/beta-hydrolase [Cytidiella melzeri]|nr:alpha/beta-hydrolase [Cytidiella melzeri]
MSFANLRQISVHYDENTVQNMLSMLKHAPIPSQAPIDAKAPWSLGMDYDYLLFLKQKFETEWKWERVEAEINSFNNFMVDYTTGEDSLQLHFVHQKSKRADAIPLLIIHGWPGTFLDFRKVIEPLTNPPSSDLPAFHVVAPSLPGYFMSTISRRDGWNLTDTAKLMNGLMTEWLGYKKYVGQGGDWGAIIMRIMSSLYADSMAAVHFNMFRSFLPDDTDKSKFSKIEKFVLARRDEFTSTGFGYNVIQTTKPFTIGLAIASSPLAILSYIGEKLYCWSDPDRVDPQDILDTVALYFLSGCFASSVVIYSQSSKQRTEVNLPPKDGLWPVKTRSFGFSSFPYEVGGSAKAPLEAYGNLAFYKEHEHGGHFPALDNAAEFVEDLREYFGANF